MACIEQKTDFNFLNWHKVVGSYTLSELQANGIPSVCDNITPVVPSLPFPSDVVAYYKLDEVSGSVIDEVSSNNGTNFGAVPNVVGKINTGYSFVANDYIDIDAVINAISTATVGTFNLWFKPVDATPINTERLLSISSTSLASSLYFHMTVTGRLAGAHLKSGVGTQWILTTDNAVFTDDTFAMVTLVQDGVSPKFYVNGSLVSQTISSVSNAAAWVNDITVDNSRLGCLNFNANGNDFFTNGLIDEVGFWNRALSAIEVSNLWNNNEGLPYAV